MTKIKIIIAGVGGVGGYFGGLLAKHFYDNESVEVSFVARGEHLKEIQRNGLKVIKGENEFIAKPHIATANTSAIGVVDFIIIATKSYDLETIIQQLRPCVNQNTIILPLLNGVDNKERIENIFPDNIVLDGCAYIVSRLKHFGVVENSGNIQLLHFGLDNFVNERLCLFERLLKEASIEASLSTSISSIIWEKFIFLSPTANATTYFDTSIGELIADSAKLTVMTTLIEEVKQVAIAKQIVISEDITEITLNKLKALPFATTSSMHSDFQSNKPANELKSLTAYVINQGRKYNLATPMYIQLYAALKKKSGI